MQTITIPISEQILAGLKFMGAEDEPAQMNMARQMIADFLEDMALGTTALHTEKEGYIGTEEGEKWLQSMKNAQD